MKRYLNFTNKFKLIHIILALIFLLSISCKIVLSYFSSNDVYIYFSRIINNEIEQFLLCVAIITVSIFMIITIKNIISKIFIIIVCIILLCVSDIFSGGFWEAEKKYFEFNSPYNDSIIIEECSWLLGGSSNVYLKENSHVIRRLEGTILTDDGYRPFTNNDYFIEWSINSVKISYGFGSNDIQKNIDINLK